MTLRFVDRPRRNIGNISDLSILQQIIRLIQISSDSRTYEENVQIAKILLTTPIINLLRVLEASDLEEGLKGGSEYYFPSLHQSVFNILKRFREELTCDDVLNISNKNPTD